MTFTESSVWVDIKHTDIFTWEARLIKPFSPNVIVVLDWGRSFTEKGAIKKGKVLLDKYKKRTSY